MRRLCLLRHLPTDWNHEKRLQGRTDRPLAPAPAVERLPFDAARWRLVSSPLRRAVETARLVFGAEPETVAALAEMDWRDFEGRRLADLRRELGDALARNEARGLDFRPPGGESPRDVQQRLPPGLEGVLRLRRGAFVLVVPGVRFHLVTHSRVLDAADLAQQQLVVGGATGAGLALAAHESRA